MIVETDAVANPVAVVVHADGAAFTFGAMVGPWRSNSLAFPAVPPSDMIP